MDRVSQSARRPTHRSRADLQTAASRAVSIHYHISRTSGGWKLVVASSFARVSDRPSAPHRAIKPDRSSHVTPELYAEGWQLYSNRLDKDWGMIDCISFVIMQERNLTEALTNDHHFEQADFKVLL